MIFNLEEIINQYLKIIVNNHLNKQSISNILQMNGNIDFNPIFINDFEITQLTTLFIILLTKTSWIIDNDIIYLSLSYEKLITILSIFITNKFGMIKFYNIFNGLSKKYDCYVIYYYNTFLKEIIDNENNCLNVIDNENNCLNVIDNENICEKKFIIICKSLNISFKQLILLFDEIENNYDAKNLINDYLILDNIGKITMLELLLILLFDTQFKNGKLLFDYGIALFVLMDYLQKSYLEYNCLKEDIEIICLKHNNYKEQFWKANFIKLYFLESRLDKY